MPIDTYPKLRAVLFEEDIEDGARSVLDIFEVVGIDAKAKRRMRRYITNRHGDCEYVDQILYEEIYKDYHFMDDDAGDSSISYDVTKRFKR